MSKIVKLSHDQVKWINTKGKGGSQGQLVHFKFMKKASDDTKRWTINDIADFMKSLPKQHIPRSYEIWVTSSTVSIGLWMPDKISMDQLENHWKTFNHALIDYKPPMLFPPIQPNSFIRVGRVRPKRNPHQPIESRFGSRGDEGSISPIVHLLNNLPKMPDGSSAIIQIMWKRNNYHWRKNPYTHVETTPGLPYDAAIMEWKSRKRISYYADIRIAEMHAKKEYAQENYCKIIGEAFHVWERDKANTLEYDNLSAWGKSKIVRLLNAMQDRDIKDLALKGTKKPHYCKEELAALVHPPPEGSDIPMALYTSLKPEKASGTQKTQAAAYNDLIKSMKAEKAAKKAARDRTSLGDDMGLTTRGRTRKMTSKEASEILKRVRDSRKDGGE